MLNYLKLIRPANILTAIADIFFGYAAAGLVINKAGFFGSEFLLTNPSVFFQLILATACLYAGGIMFNDIFDVDLDKIERPERPIPSGKISKRNATIIATLLLLIGILSASMVTIISAGIATAIAICALVYNKWGKHVPIGPLNMAMCRALNLLLGLSASLQTVHATWILTLIPFVYITAITMISKDEVRGGNSTTIQRTTILYTIVSSASLSITLLPNVSFVSILPFLLLFIFMIFTPLLKAKSNPSPQQIRKVVRAGILSLIILDATLASGFAGWGFGLLTLSLLPISILFSKLFPVT